MNWIFFSILAAVIWAVVNVIDKYILSRLVRSPFVPIIVLGFAGLIVSLFILLFRGYEYLSPQHISLALFGGVFSLLMAYFYFKAVQLEEISRVVPLLYLTPLFISLIAGVTIGEVFRPSTYLGIFLLVSGAVLISVKVPLSLSLGRAFWFMMLSALAMALLQVITKYLLKFADFWTIFAYGRLGLALVLVPIIIFCVPTLRATYQEGGARTFAIIALNEFMYVGGVLALTVAAASGFVTLVNALASVHAFFVLLFTVLLSLLYPRILKEETDIKTLALKLVAIAMMFCGALLIS